LLPGRMVSQKTLQDTFQKWTWLAPGNSVDFSFVNGCRRKSGVPPAVGRLRATWATPVAAAGFSGASARSLS
ncbi:hypothetical protein, partial [uncultured Desulfovibrio sp.]|uniref:hypothetical protein n=1 Tax=uncultured Desulfovibrio sp. TaxID=167968 RepID=UPI00261B694E